MSQITCSGQGTGQLGDYLAGAVRMVGDHRVDEPARAIPNGRLGARHDSRRERPADDVAQALVAGVVHHDHRPEEVLHFGIWSPITMPWAELKMCGWRLA